MKHTTTLDPNEKVWRLTEFNKNGRRYQAIIVNRDDELAAWIKYLGPETAFIANQFTFPMLWEHSVSEAQGMAEEKRHDDYWRKFLAEKQAESTLVRDAIEQRERHRKVIWNQSVFGPGGHTQRIGFPRKAVLDVHLGR